ncbi:hypothetical protein CRG98_027804 [Punica granatum]|uniref:Retrotransposon gag domain-containing protein n=1 Tax=Punica granatum TaxID=22663 RepID=A0A2I0J6E7_PUNGR|nr:hypothetical protein CRG98_027804 [Punica granatum]
MSFLQLTQLVEQWAVARGPPPRANRVPRRNFQVEDEPDQEDELPEEEALPVPRREQRGIGNNLNLKIPQFKGTSSPEDYLEWVQRVDKVFEYYEYSEAQKCQLAALEFTDYANLWWENIKAQRRKDREDMIRSWREMKCIMHRRFVPEYYKQDLFLKLQIRWKNSENAANSMHRGCFTQNQWPLVQDPLRSGMRSRRM